MQYRNLQLGLIGCLLIALISCHKTEPEEGEVEGGERTLLIYMAADNSLSGDADDNIQAILKGMQAVKGRVVIYLDPAAEVPRLMTTTGGRDCKLDTVAVYAEENSASMEVVTRVINDVKELYPAKSYGLIMWSHGMAWVPPGIRYPRSLMLSGRGEMPRTKYFAEDKDSGNGSGSAYIDLQQLGEQLPGGFGYILFDACFMSSIEVLYALKDKTEYVIASPAEIIASGFPYEKVMPFLWGGEEDLKRVCQEFYDYYDQHPKGGDWRSATIALVKTDGLDALAQVTREILKGGATPSEVWKYPVSTSGFPAVFFDFRDYIASVASEEQTINFDQQLAKIVRYKKATEEMFGVPVPDDRYSGISSYIPFSQWPVLNGHYNNLEWTKVVYGE